MKIAERVLRRWAADNKTYMKSREDIFEHLTHQGWKCSSPELKVPYATSPDGNLRLWFKPQAVHFTEGGSHTLGNARAVGYDLDIRKLTPTQFLARVDQRFM